MDASSSHSTQFNSNYSSYFNAQAGTFRGASASSSFNAPTSYGSHSQTQETGSSFISDFVPSRQTIGLVGIIACGFTLIGTTTYFIAKRVFRKKRESKRHKSQDEDQLEILSDEEEDFNERLFKERSRKRSLQAGANSRSPPLITFADLFEHALQMQQQRLKQRETKIYFDSNDEFVRQEQIPELLQSHRSIGSHEDSLDDVEEQHRIHERISFRYNSVEVFFGNEEKQHSGTTKITRNIFAGGHDRYQNALIFLENLNKVKQNMNQYAHAKAGLMARKYSRDQHDGLMSQASYPTQNEIENASAMSVHQSGIQEYNSDSGFESLDPVYEEQNEVEEDEVLLNISPKKFEKPKDQLYMDFFMKYTELFVKEQEKGPKQTTMGGLKITTEKQKGSRQKILSQKDSNKDQVGQKVHQSATSSLKGSQAVF